MTQVGGQTNRVQVTAARPEGWSLQELFVRGVLVFITIILVTGAVVALALLPSSCCFDLEGDSCTSEKNCYCFGPNVVNNTGELRPCPVGGPELCNVETACFFPRQLFQLWGSDERMFYVTPSGQRLSCPQIMD